MSWTGSHYIPAGYVTYRDFGHRRPPEVVPGSHHPALVRSQRLDMLGTHPQTLHGGHSQLHSSHPQLNGGQPQPLGGHQQLSGGHPHSFGGHLQSSGSHPQLSAGYSQSVVAQPQPGGGHRQEPSENRAVREAFRKERKLDSYLADDLNFPLFAKKLKGMGLQLRDIPADGNCLFRGLGDQLEGHCRNHYRHRQDVATFMQNHRKDFEPFVEDDVPFDEHINNLKKLGTHAGNDAIFAFARLHNINVIIHQLAGNPLQISGPSSSANVRQVHLAYHNGDHYSSVRRDGDNTESPANIRTQENSETVAPPLPLPSSDKGGVVTAKRDVSHLEAEVTRATGCQDAMKVRKTLKDNNYDVDVTIASLLQTLDLGASTQAGDDTTSVASHQTTDSGIWAATGATNLIMGGGASGTSSVKGKGQKVHFREDSYGGSSGYSSMGSSRGGGGRPKLLIPQAPVQYQIVTGRKAKELRRLEKKKKM